MRRISYIITSLIMVFSMATITAFAKPDWPIDTGIQSEAGIVMDMDSGAVLFAQNIHEQKIPASITKLLTALVVIENTNDLDAPVTFSHDAIYNVESGAGNKFNLEEGDVLSVRQCLYAMLLQSSNQSANALAEYVAGSRQAFVDMMNQRIAELGCNESHFANPSGLNDDTQRTTAYDMAIIARACFQNPTVLEIASARTSTIPATANNPNGRTFSIEHKMLLSDDSNYYPDAIAGKTGWTSQAGQTLVTYARREGRGQIAVTLKSTQKTHYSDTKTILDFGFKRFKNVNVAENETHCITGEEPVEINGVSYLPSELYLDDTAVITLPNDAEFGDADQYLQTEIPENHPEGAVGRIIYSYNDRQIGVAWLYTTKALSSAAEPSQEAPEQTDPSSSKEPSEKKGISLPDGLIAGAGAVVLLLIAVCGIYAAVQQRKEKERLARMKERRRKRLEEMGCSQDEFERLLNERKAALGKRTANDEPEDLL